MANDTDKKNAVPLIAKKIAEAKFLSLMIDDKKIKEIYSGAVPGVDNVTRELTAEFKRDVERAVNTELKRLISTPRTFSITGKTALKTIDVRGIPKGTLQGIEDAYRAAITEVVTDSGLVAGAGAASLVKALESAVKLDWSSVSPKNLTHRQFKFGSQDDARAFVRAMKASSNAKEFIMRQEEGVVDLYVPPGARSNLVSKTGVAKPVLSVAREAHKSIQDERAKTLSAESRFIASQFPDWTGAEGYSSLSEAERKELLRNAGVKQRRSIVSDMDPSVVKEMTMAATSKTFKVQEATIQGIEEILNDPELNPFGLKTPEEWVAKHGLRASEWQGLPSYFRSQVNAIRHESSINQYLEDPELFKRNVFATQKKQLATYEAVKEFYTDETSEGYNTREGKRFRKSLQREDEAEAMEGSGRIGAMLRKLGVSPETAGKAGRIFGAVGAVGVVVGAIVGLGGLLVKALKNVEEEVKKQGIASMARAVGTVATGVSNARFRLYESFKAFAAEAGLNVDLNKSYRQVASNISEVITNTPGFAKALKGANLMYAVDDSDSTNLMALMTSRGANAETVTNNLAMMYMRGVAANKSLVGIGAPELELGSYLREVGIDTDTLMTIMRMLAVKVGSSEDDYKAAGAYLASLGGDDTTKFLAVLEKIGGTGLAKEVMYGTDTVLAKLLGDILASQNQVAGATDMLKQYMAVSFGPQVTQLMSSLNDSMLTATVILAKTLGGVDAEPIIAQLNIARMEKMSQQDAEAAHIIGLADKKIEEIVAYFVKKGHNRNMIYSSLGATSHPDSTDLFKFPGYIKKLSQEDQILFMQAGQFYYARAKLQEDIAQREKDLADNAKQVKTKTPIKQSTLGNSPQGHALAFALGLSAEGKDAVKTIRQAFTPFTAQEMSAIFTAYNLPFVYLGNKLLPVETVVDTGEAKLDARRAYKKDPEYYEVWQNLAGATKNQEQFARGLSRGDKTNEDYITLNFSMANIQEFAGALNNTFINALKANPMVFKPTINLTSGWEARGEVVVRVLADKGLVGEAGKGSLTVRTSGFDVDNVAAAQE